MSRAGLASPIADASVSLRWVAASCIALTVACGAGPRHPTGATSVPATPVAPATTVSTDSTVSTAAPTCSNASAVAAWPVSKRAAQLIVVPALNGNIASLGPTIGAGIGGVLLLGQITPADLDRQVVAAGRAAGQPLLVMADEEGGGVQRLAGRVGPPLPWARQMAATMPLPQVRQAATHLAVEMKA